LIIEILLIVARRYTDEYYLNLLTLTGGALPTTLKGVKTEYIERAYKSGWHLLIAAVGVYELRNHKTRLSKVLACGLIAFHVDAAICDALNIPTTLQRMLTRCTR
jgi:hypothetical protein